MCVCVCVCVCVCMCVCILVRELVKIGCCTNYISVSAQFLKPCLSCGR